MIISPSGEGVRVQRISAGGGSLTFEMTMPKSRQNKVSGLLGNFNGDSSDDIKTGSGEVLPSNPNYEQLYKVFGNSWRVSQKESLFDYARGETTANFTDLSFPTKIVRTSDFPSNRRAEAERTCRDAGVREPELLEACMFDILATGDNQFAQVSANLEQKLASDVEAASDDTTNSSSPIADTPGAIDQLWVKYSGGKFSFSVQKKIYQSNGGKIHQGNDSTRDYDTQVWKAFGTKVGWREGDKWLDYTNLTYNLNTPYMGHLPWVGEIISTCCLPGMEACEFCRHIDGRTQHLNRKWVGEQARMFFSRAEFCRL